MNAYECIWMHMNAYAHILCGWKKGGRGGRQIVETQRYGAYVCVGSLNCLASLAKEPWFCKRDLKKELWVSFAEGTWRFGDTEIRTRHRHHFDITSQSHRHHVDITSPSHRHHIDMLRDVSCHMAERLWQTEREGNEGIWGQIEKERESARGVGEEGDGEERKRTQREKGECWGRRWRDKERMIDMGGRHERGKGGRRTCPQERKQWG